jgi:hypothetical protein
MTSHVTASCSEKDGTLTDDANSSSIGTTGVTVMSGIKPLSKKHWLIVRPHPHWGVLYSTAPITAPTTDPNARMV